MGYLKRHLLLAAATCVLTLTSARAAEPPREFLKFPKGFKWCVSTSAHQIEGYNDNSDWWDWEKAGHIKHGDISGPACDHWNRTNEDVDLIRALHVKKYRFSIEWAKIEPTEGRFDLEAIEHYRHEVRRLLQMGIEPFITLHHFTLPRWLAAKGGLEALDFSTAFANYTKFVVSQLAYEGVRDWVTFNEPMVLIAAAYVRGIFPPGIARSKLEGLRAPIEGVLRAHAAAYREIKVISPKARVGVAHHLRVFDPSSPLNPISRILASSLDRIFNWAFVEALETGRFKASAPFLGKLDLEVDSLKGTQDYVGVNYYSRDMVSLDFNSYGFIKFQPKRGRPVNDLGWEIYPKGFYRILKEVTKRVPGKPLMITENGTADAKDTQRPEFIKNHLRELHRAISEGVKVEAYCHWSLMDNFEWLEGFEPRFGLYAVDYATLKRVPRASAKEYSDIARRNGFWSR